MSILALRSKIQDLIVNFHLFFKSLMTFTAPITLHSCKSSLIMEYPK